jgi:hypothetical protein
MSLRVLASPMNVLCRVRGVPPQRSSGRHPVAAGKADPVHFWSIPLFSATTAEQPGLPIRDRPSTDYPFLSKRTPFAMKLLNPPVTTSYTSVCRETIEMLVTRIQEPLVGSNSLSLVVRF